MWLTIDQYLFNILKKTSIWMRFDFQTLFQSLTTFKMNIYFEMLGLTFLHSLTMLKSQDIFLTCFHYHALFWLWAQGQGNINMFVQPYPWLEYIILIKLDCVMIYCIRWWWISINCIWKVGFFERNLLP